MNLIWQRRGAGASFTLLLVAGCTGAQPQNTAVLPNTAPARSVAGDRLRADDLLYVADRRDASVAMYAFSTGRASERITNFRANGMCANDRGAVFIATGGELAQYAHGGTRQVATLRGAPGAVLQSCAADAVTGDVAAIDSAGRVTVFSGAQHVARRVPGRGRYSALAYDNAGNLFLTNGRSVQILPHAATQPNGVLWNGTKPVQIGAMAWDEHYLAIESLPQQGTTTLVVSRYGVSANRLTFVDSITLQHRAGSGGFAVYGGNLIMAEANGIAFYGYAQAGRAASVLHDSLDPQFVTVSRAPAPAFSVTTYHDDNFRTGWDDSESTLTYQKVRSNSFGLLASVPLDDQVDAQPLVVPAETTTRGASPGQHDVVYVVTENDSVYAIDASTGKVLMQQSLGTPVQTPLGCTNNGPNVGITSTPVIDLANNVMYVIAYTMESSVPVYRIHELSLSDLTDVVPSVIVSASHQLTNDQTITFDATYERQRPALLEANGNIYAGFGSFCDYAGSISRGWLLGWQAGSLTPLAANRLNNSLATSPDDFFLSSIWMSGYGPAADSSGNIYFVTGNSDYSGNTYNGVTNVNESVVKVTPDLATMLSIFTPSNVGYLDEIDEDFGSGGVLVVPAASSSKIAVAAAAGKYGTMFLMNQHNLGGFDRKHGGDRVLDTVNIGGCWCGESYYASQGQQHIVASGGNAVTLWNIGSGHKPKLNLAATSPTLPGGQDPGFFTSISSDANGRHAIIWALARPQNVPGSMSLYAFAGEPSHGSYQLRTLFQTASAGYWAASNGNANLVPVVANGRVYVASYQQLNIYGLGAKKGAIAVRHGSVVPYRVGGRDRVVGRLVGVRGSLLSLRTITGATAQVDDTVAVRSQRTGDLVRGELFVARGRYDQHHVLHAVTIVRAKPSQAQTAP